MNFDRLAPFYPWMEVVLAGSLMQRCRCAFLSETVNCRHALIIGEGTGRFLAELLRFNPHLVVSSVDSSKKMLELSRSHLIRKGFDLSRVSFEHADIFDLSSPSTQYDLVVTHFFLDCFSAEQLGKLIPLVGHRMTAKGMWLVADFRIPEKGWKRRRAEIILGVLYPFFKFWTSLSARWLTAPNDFLTSAGFNLMEQRLFSFGLLYSSVWKKNAPLP